MKKNDLKILNIVLPLLTLLCIFGVWVAAAIVTGEEIIIPSPSSTLKKFLSLFTEKTFYSALGSTLLRTLIAFAFSFILAFVCAVFSAKFYCFEVIVNTLIPLIRGLPTIAIILLLVLWTRSSTAAMIVTALVVFPTAYTNAKFAVGKIDKEIIETCTVYRIDRKNKIFKIYLPMMIPELISSAGAGFSLNLKLMVAAEVLAQTPTGLGMLMNYSKIYFETAKLVALVLVSLIIGLIVETACVLIRKRLVKKYD